MHVPCSRRATLEAVEPHLLDSYRRIAVIGNDHRHAHRLPGNDDPVVGERFDADAVRGDERLLELALLLEQPELDLELRAVVDRHGAKLAAQHAHRAETSEQRLHRRAIAFGVELFLRRLHR